MQVKHIIQVWSAKTARTKARRNRESVDPSSRHVALVRHLGLLEAPEIDGAMGCVTKESKNRKVQDRLGHFSILREVQDRPGRIIDVLSYCQKFRT